MSKSKKNNYKVTTLIDGKEKDITALLDNDAENPIEKTCEIRSAKLKDAFCNYTYELTQGVMAGDACSRSGASVVHDDMLNAFGKLNVHLAVICEEINSSDISDIDAIEQYNDEVHDKESLEYRVSLFRVSAFLLDGNGEKESVVLIGEKRLSTGDYVQLKTPRIYWIGAYAFIDELRVAVDDLIHEVELYMNGKTAPKFIQTEMNLPEASDDKNDENLD